MRTRLSDSRLMRSALRQARWARSRSVSSSMALAQRLHGRGSSTIAPNPEYPVNTAAAAGRLVLVARGGVQQQVEPAGLVAQEARHQEALRIAHSRVIH